MNSKARHNRIYAKCRWRSDRLDGAGSFWEPLGQTQVMQIRQGETPNHQGAITHDLCCLSCQLRPFWKMLGSSITRLTPPKPTYLGGLAGRGQSTRNTATKRRPLSIAWEATERALHNLRTPRIRGIPSSYWKG